MTEVRKNDTNMPIKGHQSEIDMSAMSIPMSEQKEDEKPPSEVNGSTELKNNIV